VYKLKVLSYLYALATGEYLQGGIYDDEWWIDMAPPQRARVRYYFRELEKRGYEYFVYGDGNSDNRVLFMGGEWSDLLYLKAGLLGFNTVGIWVKYSEMDEGNDDNDNVKDIMERLSWYLDENERIKPFKLKGVEIIGVEDGVLKIRLDITLVEPVTGPMWGRLQEGIHVHGMFEYGEWWRWGALLKNRNVEELIEYVMDRAELRRAQLEKIVGEKGDLKEWYKYVGMEFAAMEGGEWDHALDDWESDWEYDIEWTDVKDLIAGDLLRMLLWYAKEISRWTEEDLQEVDRARIDFLNGLEKTHRLVVKKFPDFLSK